MSIDCSSHSYKCFHWHTESFAISRKQYKCIQEPSKDCHQNSTCCHTDDGTLSGMHFAVNDSCRYNERTSEKEVGKFTNTCGNRAVDCKVQKNFDQFDRSTCNWTHSKTSYQYRDFAKVNLVKGRCKWQWDLEKHQYNRDGSEHSDLCENPCLRRRVCAFVS